MNENKQTRLDLKANTASKKSLASMLVQQPLKFKLSFLFLLATTTLCLAYTADLLPWPKHIQSQQENKTPAQKSSEREPKPPLYSKEGLTAGERYEFTLAPGLKVAFRWCPPGTFQMGALSTTSTKTVPATYKINLTQGYWMQETEFTQEQWRLLMGGTIAYQKASIRSPRKKANEGPKHPMYFINRTDISKCISKINHLAKLYHGDTAATPLIAKLPTEAQWEYACRAGTTTNYYFGNTINDSQACFNKSTTEIKETKHYPPNAWGIHDMHGNLSELCQDIYTKYLTDATDPTGPLHYLHAITHDKHVVRGGNWSSPASTRKSSLRQYTFSSTRNDKIGFRIVLQKPLPVAKIQGKLAGEQKEFEIYPGVKCKFRWCPSGSLKKRTSLVASPEQPNIDMKGFWIQETEFTQGQWKAIKGIPLAKLKSHFARTKLLKERGDQHPMYLLNWYHVSNCIQKLNNSGTIAHGWVIDLPTELQWEYACKAGTTTIYNVGDTIEQQHANLRFTTGVPKPTEGTKPVRSYPPNPWGIYDMHGNVSEVCHEQHPDRLNKKDSPTTRDFWVEKALRGESWLDTQVTGENMGSEQPGLSSINFTTHTQGFRLVIKPH